MVSKQQVTVTSTTSYSPGRLPSAPNLERNVEDECIQVVEFHFAILAGAIHVDFGVLY